MNDCPTCKNWYPDRQKLCPACKDRKRRFNLATRMVEKRADRVREGV